MTTPDPLDTDVIQDRILRLQAALQAKDFSLGQVYEDLIAISQEMLFIAEDFESRRINSIVPGANVRSSLFTTAAAAEWPVEWLKAL